MLNKILVLITLSLSGCSLGIANPGPTVICHTEVCPSDAHVGRLMTLFHDRAAVLFDPQESLEVHWYAEDHDFGPGPNGGTVIGYTASPDEVHVINARVLMHEIMHVHLWRTFPEFRGDGDHESGDGPWTGTTNNVVWELANEAETLVEVEE